MSAQTASIRLTHKYRDGWSEEDEWQEAGEYEVLGSVGIEPPSDGCAMSVLIIKNLTINEEAVRVALMGTISGSHCRHEHDCCGCWSRSVLEVVPLTQAKSLWAVTIAYHQNI